MSNNESHQDKVLRLIQLIQEQFEELPDGIFLMINWEASRATVGGYFKNNRRDIIERLIEMVPRQAKLWAEEAEKQIPRKKFDADKAN